MLQVTRGGVVGLLEHRLLVKSEASDFRPVAPGKNS